MFIKWLKTMLLCCAMIICSLFFINTAVNAAGTTGWVCSSNTWYYYQNGNKVVNSWKADSQGWCYLGAEGACAKNSIQADSNGLCYIGADGYWSKRSAWGQDSITKNWFFIGPDGYAVKNSWVRDSQGWCYLGADGAWVTSGWVQDSQGWCHINAYGYWDGLAQVATIPATKAIYTDAANEASYNLANASNFTIPTITATINGQSVTVTPVITNSNGEIIKAIDTAIADTYTIKYTAKGADNSYVITATVASATRSGGGGSSAKVVSAIGAISGTAGVGDKLTAGALTPAGAAVTYQWKICDTLGGTYTDIAGATANYYIPTMSDIGKFIKVSAKGKGSYTGTITSEATSAVAALPSQSGLPAFTAGIPAKTLTQITVGPGNLGIQTNIHYTWYSSDTGTYAAGIDTQVASDTTMYTPAAADVGKYLIVVVTTPDATGNGMVVTPAVIEKIIGPMAPPSITGTFPVAATSINLANLSGIIEFEAAVSIDGVTYGSYTDLVVDGSGQATISGLSGVTTSTKVKIRAAETPTTLPGPDTVITVTEAPSIVITLTDLAEKGLITEGAENSRTLTVALNNDTFVQADVTTGNITITGLPAGVTVGSVNYINPTIITITLAGNSTADYDTNITATVNVASAVLNLGGADITSDIWFTAVVEAALDAPITAVVNDANDTFGWTNNAAQTNAADYEYSVDSGADWTTCTANPQTGIIGAYAAGVVQVRAKATLRNPASAALVSAAPYNPLVMVAVSNGLNANTVEPRFTVNNTSSYALDLKTLKLNYYYTADGNQSQTFQCYFAGTSGEFKELTSYVVGNIKTLSPTTSTADTYLQVSFSDGSLAAGQSMTIHASVNKADWTNYDQSNDYSYNASNNVTAYVNGVKIFGTTP